VQQQLGLGQVQELTLLGSVGQQQERPEQL